MQLVSPTDGAAGADFSSASGVFGACLRTSTPGVTADWIPAPAGDCAGSGSHWQAVPATMASATSQIASAAVGDMDATVSLNFGVRMAYASKGTFVAPITFSVVAP